MELRTKFEVELSIENIKIKAFRIFDDDKDDWSELQFRVEDDGVPMPELDEETTKMFREFFEMQLKNKRERDSCQISK